MLLTDIYVPSVNETYDFYLEENVPVRQVTETAVRILQRKTAGREEPDAGAFALYSYEKKGRLDPDRTLAECGIRSGSRLLLV